MIHQKIILKPKISSVTYANLVCYRRVQVSKSLLIRIKINKTQIANTFEHRSFKKVKTASQN